MKKLLRWGGFGLGVILTLHGISLIFTPDGLFPGRRARTFWLFQGIAGVFGTTFTQALAVLFSVSIGVSMAYLAITWKQKSVEKE